MLESTVLRRRGLELLEELHGGHAGEAIVAEMRDICPFFAEMTIDWALGGVMARPGLDLLAASYHGASVPHRSEVLGGIEAERPGIAERPG